MHKNLAQKDHTACAIYNILFQFKINHELREIGAVLAYVQIIYKWKYHIIGIRYYVWMVIAHMFYVYIRISLYRDSFLVLCYSTAYICEYNMHLSWIISPFFSFEISLLQNTCSEVKWSRNISDLILLGHSYLNWSIKKTEDLSFTFMTVLKHLMAIVQSCPNA